MKKGDTVNVWNHTIMGELIVEGEAELVRKDRDFDGVLCPIYLADQVKVHTTTDRVSKVDGPFSRWHVRFIEGEVYSRWVRHADIIK